MSTWIITSDRNGDTPHTVGIVNGTQQEAAAELAVQTEACGKSLEVWKLMGHTHVAIEVTVVPDDGE